MKLKKKYGPDRAEAMIQDQLLGIMGKIPLTDAGADQISASVLEVLQDAGLGDAVQLAAEHMQTVLSDRMAVDNVDDITKKLGHFERPVGKYPKLDWTQGVTDRCRAAMNEENRDITEATNQLNELLIELDELKFEAWRCYTAPEFDAKLTAMRQLADRIRQRLALASTKLDGRDNS